MGSFREDLLRDVVVEVRKIPQRDFDLRQYEVVLRTVTWTGRRVGDGTATSADTVLTMDGAGTRMKLRQVTSREIVASGGKYEEGDFKIGPFTPAFPGGGRAPDFVLPAQSASPTEVRVRVTGPGMAGVWCSIIDTQTTKNFSYTFTLRRTNQTG